MSLTASFGLRGGIGPANNAASKAGVAGLTRTLALEVARHRVDVSCVARGATKTPMTATIPSHLEQRLVDRAPLKRMAKPKKIANAHLFLVSDESSYITGQCIFADGRSALGVQAPGGSCLSSEVYDEI